MPDIRGGVDNHRIAEDCDLQIKVRSRIKLEVVNIYEENRKHNLCS